MVLAGPANLAGEVLRLVDNAVRGAAKAIPTEVEAAATPRLSREQVRKLDHFETAFNSC